MYSGPRTSALRQDSTVKMPGPIMASPNHEACATTCCLRLRFRGFAVLLPPSAAPCPCLARCSARHSRTTCQQRLQRVSGCSPLGKIISVGRPHAAHVSLGCSRQPGHFSVASVPVLPAGTNKVAKLSGSSRLTAAAHRDDCTHITGGNMRMTKLRETINFVTAPHSSRLTACPSRLHY
jgi:hypothetical protein